MQAALLPLFPLPVVVFPRTRLPLHIFEDRYKELIGEAIRDTSEFGIVYAQDNGIVNAGCSVRVEHLTKTYPDGRLDIVTIGVRRFELHELNDERSFLRGSVTFFDDDDILPATAEVRFRVLAGYKDWLALGEPNPTGEPDLTDPQLSFQLAAPLRDTDFQQLLLRSRSEADRLLKVAEFLESYVVKQRETARMRDLAARNGHGATPPGTH